ncbi:MULTISPECIES: cytochrome-c oxidase, cbb3-type subunit III [Sphingobium]|jgi:cytochrome c oxidase cbb3-type subunit 3|uniref:Cbb3-type cytochrome c oxidase subunit n=1 Tax=Sphingobium limneticum TaxID=1007511 RepID=A0A5J5HTL0_9SPHN|nr:MULTISPECIES: cytochrome-c oxidase, cbb3-type subunit III [Sphingobium]MBU0931887.1 cytochrome-c oxidase, cbb3-type subunit III [Alphaproteobacteria bacterium]KAA9011800.1 cytochrome-c oxidase, cbb3-type subunit III [Sphingobium limneticum]KAA9012586.1 cytochrome-c oxidase, cbb3-type subunit III [Sphingobium limneticum]KAA9024431.1 cytochrome-c oxidase, cbb3-type subunit III [Sphingobium limneticum]BBD02761.1 cytochrome c oxidase cbb3-type subunit III [Sphingobium sp. YG1]
MADGQDKHIDVATGTELKGHEWDGIAELDTPLPRWWLWTFYATILFAIGYVIAYPAIPMLHDYTRGALGWSSRGALDKELAAREAEVAPLRRAIADTAITDLPARPQLMQAAVEGGRAAFKVHCVQCHGSGAAGAKGYPNLNDDDWLWGGDLATIEKTITDGVRNPDHAETRVSIMPAFGRDQLLTGAQVNDVLAHVRVISRQDKTSAASQRGAKVFADNCAVCHGADGKGTRVLGAPNLTDGLWLYGGDAETIRETVWNSRQGVMPRWDDKLDKATIRMLATYVHSLGGGEAAPVEAGNGAQ